MRSQSIQLHRFEPASRVNGPGLRAVIWVQGCALACPGCFNPETHAAAGGERVPVNELAARVLALKDKVEGLTISGGEPLYQHRALAQLLAEVRGHSNLSTLVFTGYDWDELQRFPGIEEFLGHVDLLLAGRYDDTRRVAQSLIGSSNKTAHFLTERYTPKDLEQVPHAEVILSPEGEIILSGIDPLQW